MIESASAKTLTTGGANEPVFNIRNPKIIWPSIGIHLEMLRIDPNGKLEASWRARQRSRDALPKRIADMLTKGRELVKEARGLKR